MATLAHVLLRESVLKALATFPVGASGEELARVARTRLHPDVFPHPAEVDVPSALDAMAREGLIARRDGRLHVAADAAAERAFLALWFDALGGPTWVAEGLHRAPLPTQAPHFEALRAAGVTVLYSFEEAIPLDAARAHGLDCRPHFWEDNGRPTMEEMDRFLADWSALPPGTQAAAHCKAGLGRTGMAIVCALASRNGWDADAALAAYWEKVPLARHVMEGHGQAEFVRAYCAARRA